MIEEKITEEEIEKAFAIFSEIISLTPLGESIWKTAYQAYKREKERADRSYECWNRELDEMARLRRALESIAWSGGDGYGRYDWKKEALCRMNIAKEALRQQWS